MLNGSLLISMPTTHHQTGPSFHIDWPLQGQSWIGADWHKWQTSESRWGMADGKKAQGPTGDTVVLGLPWGHLKCKISSIIHVTPRKIYIVNSVHVKPVCRPRAWRMQQWCQPGWPFLPLGRYGCSGVGSAWQGPSSCPPWPALWPGQTQTEEWLWITTTQHINYYMSCLNYSARHNWNGYQPSTTAKKSLLNLELKQQMLSCKPACWTAWCPEWGKPMRWLEGWSPSQRSSPTAAPGLPPGQWHHAVHHCSLWVKGEHI